MPHLTLEYSANLRNFGGIDALCQTLAGVLAAQRVEGRSVYPLGGIRVRALAAEEFAVGDGRRSDAGFVHGCLKIGAGRSEAVRRATGDALFDAMKAHFAREFQSRGLALSLEIAEFSESGTWKHNNLHQRFAAADGTAMPVVASPADAAVPAGGTAAAGGTAPAAAPPAVTAGSVPWTRTPADPAHGDHNA